MNEITQKQPQFSQMMMGQHCLGKTKHKQAFKSTSNSCYGIFENFYLTEFSTD